MSQQLVPISGGVQTLRTSAGGRSVNTPSLQYIDVKKLKSRPTEWASYGRPIYQRLPAASETYQTNFFDILPATNTAIQLGGTRDVGYVYIPWGEGIFGPVSAEAIASDSTEDLIIKAGQIVWKYGTTVVPPAILNLKELDFGSGRYLVAYQLVYDDAPVKNYYQVEDYSLAGTKLILSSSSEGIIGWRYPSVNAFLSNGTYWSNSDMYFPSFVQPGESFIQWESNETFQSSPVAPETILPSAYSNVVLRCPPGTNYSGAATLSYVYSSDAAEVETSTVAADQAGQFFEFNIVSPSLQTGWRVDFTESSVKIQSVTVSGVVTKVTHQAGPATRCALAIYPAEAVPTTVFNSLGEEIPATYCNLAYIDVDFDFKLLDIQDIRPIINREYKPIADWLTKPFDEDLINFYEQIQGYSTLWMSPIVCLHHEYLALETVGVELT